MAKPYYIVEFSASACLFEIRVNDVPVMTLEIPGQASSMTPVNFAILNSGQQTITAAVLPIPGTSILDENAKLRYELKLYDVNIGYKFKQSLMKFEFPAVDVQKKQTVQQKSDTFYAEVPYRLKGWANGRNLNEVKDVKDKLAKAYQRIAGYIRNKRYGELKQALQNREIIMTTSMYLDQPVGSRVDSMIRDFENGFELIPFPGDLSIRYYAGGKMAALRRLNGDHAICAQNQEQEEEVLLDLAFYIPEGKDEFEVI